MHSPILQLATFLLVLVGSQVAEAAVRGIATFEGDIHGDIQIIQEDADSIVEVGGQLSGLDEGQYIMLLVSGLCDNVAMSVRLGELTHWDQGPGDTVELGTRERGPVAGEGGTIMDRQITLKTDDVVGLVVKNCEVGSGGFDCDKGTVMACTGVEWADQGGRPTGLSWQMLIIIAVAVLIFFIVLICIPLICCCIKRHRRKNLTTETDLEDEYEDRSKSPMYDELSLPFIDQSLPPTPKVGRVVNGLDILLGHSVSENSLVDKKSQVQW